MARYAPELVAHVRQRYEDTDDTLAKIATDCGISERTVNRMRDRGGWARRGDRMRDVPPAMRALQEATALLARPAASSPLSSRPSDPRPDRGEREPGPSIPEAGVYWVPALAPSALGRDDRLRVFAEETESAQGGTRPPSAAGAASPLPIPPSAIERIERLVEQELAAEEAVRAQLGPLPRPPADAERAARTLATLTQTLHALARLRCGRAPDSGSDDDDDMPRDIDEFRRELARRIDAFVASRTEPQPARADGEPANVDDVR